MWKSCIKVSVKMVCKIKWGRGSNGNEKRERGVCMKGRVEMV